MSTSFCASTRGGYVALTCTNNYLGGTSIVNGALNISSLSDLGSGGITFDGGTLQYAAGFTGSTDFSTQAVTIDAGGATIDTNGNAVAFSNSIGNGGAGGLTVIDSSGGGTLTLGGGESYQGGTTIDGGTPPA